MHNESISTLATRSVLGLFLALTLGSSPDARAQELQGSEATMTEQCAEMKAQKQKMKEEMQVHNAHLTQELTEMNAASRRKKPDLMAAVLTHTIELRIEMDAKKAKMEEEMMKHMMKHMQMGKDSMATCPMMKVADSADAKPAMSHQTEK